MLDTGVNAGLTVNRPKSEMNKTFQVLKVQLHGKPYIKMKGASQDPAFLAREEGVGRVQVVGVETGAVHTLATPLGTG